MGGRPSFPVVNLPKERVVIVTGGNTGLGYEIAKWIAMMGATVIIACRSEERAQQAIEKMNKEYREEKEKGTEGLTNAETLAVEYMECDLGSFTSTKKFVDRFKETGKPLHVLVCNAGIGMAPFSKTEDGFESMFQVNYLGHFMMIGKLLPIMKQSGDDCRILLMSSDAHRIATFDLATVNYDGRPEKFPRPDYYGRSKLYQIMQMHSLCRRLKDTSISVNSSHPGIVLTEIRRNFDDMRFWRMFTDGSKAIGVAKTPFEGAKSLINAAVNPELKGINGIYYIDCKPGHTTSNARNVDKQEALWKYTIDILKDHLTAEEITGLEGGNPG